MITAGIFLCGVLAGYVFGRWHARRRAEDHAHEVLRMARRHDGV